MLTRNDVKIISRTLVANGFLKIFKIELAHRLFAGGESQPFQRELMERGQAVAVALYDDTCGKVVLVEQFRIGAIDDPASPWLLEFPAGVVKDGESAEEVALRECAEEVGREPVTLQNITTCYPSPGGCSERIAILYGTIDSTGLDQTIQGLDTENEDIRVHVVDIAAALVMIRDGRICNAATIIGLYWLANRLGLTV